MLCFVGAVPSSRRVRVPFRRRVLKLYHGNVLLNVKIVLDKVERKYEPKRTVIYRRVGNSGKYRYPTDIFTVFSISQEPWPESYEVYYYEI